MKMRDNSVKVVLAFDGPFSLSEEGKKWMIGACGGPRAFSARECDALAEERHHPLLVSMVEALGSRAGNLQIHTLPRGVYRYAIGKHPDGDEKVILPRPLKWVEVDPNYHRNSWGG